MSAPRKRFNIQNDFDEDSTDNIHTLSRKEHEPETAEQGMEIQVDFEGRNPQDPDYHGIKMLLQQLFLKAHVDLGGLTDLIISQSYIGSVIKQADDSEYSEDDEEDSNVNDVFGITSVINISDKEKLLCIKQLRELLKQLASEHATDATNTEITNILNDKSLALGLIVNERFINIPAQISIPLLENLISEIGRAVNRNMAFNFQYYILICKLYKEKLRTQADQNKVQHTEKKSSIVWSNLEEQIFDEEATLSFEFLVDKETDSGLSGSWSESDDELIPYRRVLLFEASKLEVIVQKIKDYITKIS